MAYSQFLSSRLETLLAELSPVRKVMFGGVGYLVRGNMLCGVIGDDLILRVGPHRYESVLTHPHARPFDMTGKPMRGWVVIQADGIGDDGELGNWIELAAEFNAKLPEK